MTCPFLLRHTPEGGLREERLLAPAGPAHLPHQATALRARLQRDDALAQFARFVIVGGVSSALYAAVFVSLAGLGDQPANWAGAIASTLLANELHRRLTFHAGTRVSWFTAQWEGGGLAAVGLVATSLTLAGVHGLVGDVGTTAQLGLIAAVTGAIGLIRFIALRTWVFSPASHRS